LSQACVRCTVTGATGIQVSRARDLRRALDRTDSWLPLIIFMRRRPRHRHLRHASHERSGP
jgi:hypothetical protein